MYEQSFLRLLGVIEGTLVPETSFIKQERLALRVPVARDAKLAGSVEVIFHQLRSGLRFVILIESAIARQRLCAIVQRSNVVRVHNRLPLAVQIRCLAPVDIGNQGCNLSGGGGGEKKTSPCDREKSFSQGSHGWHPLRNCTQISYHIPPER